MKHINPPEWKRSALIADYPAWTIYRAKPRKHYDTGRTLPQFSACEILGLPFVTKRHGIQYQWFQFGSAVSYALQNGDCPIKSYQQAQERGHKTHWLNSTGTTLTAEPQEKQIRLALNFGEEVIFEGRVFRLDPAANNNADLFEIVEI